ncbi:hypothetical protein PC129_g4765 [Phytophthora cactorum]|uniref:S-adenosyl-L-methionine-dependent methyltransferase n=1 Tax=Phytophthora cactorum TaxID=29920 RepID=A0A329SYV7_9STRA|nr:hypothetical protein PC121_g20 [Phytophthora cactorum]KAG3193279.1 hypothetical protein C6341_g130 [Phytophthora cactorum]KAG3224594.1 hypothetical protein PC129_g4765 [Phytophthora cactorum]KAG4249996.1 hypothetical protein PC116_g2356 [Phytophthora cactorum]RAW41775.1 hypothetical protein PC110_g2066 [Phytophthora cactorum]
MQTRTQRPDDLCFDGGLDDDLSSDTGDLSFLEEALVLRVDGFDGLVFLNACTEALRDETAVVAAPLPAAASAACPPWSLSTVCSLATTRQQVFRNEQQLGLPENLQDPMTLRLTDHPASLIELQEVLRQQLLERLSKNKASNQVATELGMKIEVYDQKQQQFALLEELSQLRGRRSRLSVTLTNADALLPGRTCLALPSRIFGFDVAAGDKFAIDGRVVYIGEVGNSGKGTGLTTWDGSVVLAKYLEHQRRSDITGSRVVELGAGTGLVGISAALLGARHVTLSDLAYVVDNLAKNVAETMKLAAIARRPIESDVSTQVLDWFNPPTDLGDIDFLLASDVVWVEELIPPLVGTFATLLRHSTVKTRILMSYQKRSIMSDRLLFSELERYNLVKTRVPAASLHPEFSTDRIDVWEIERGGVAERSN